MSTVTIKKGAAQTSAFQIDPNKQISATYARNNFKEVTSKVEKEGMCVIFKKSKPSIVMLSLEEYTKLLARAESEELFQKNIQKKAQKITKAELNKLSGFTKYIGCFAEQYPHHHPNQLKHDWAEYID